ncbi:MAG: hypothetical protein M9924_13735 [Rhizobiaceae bacterium]|nr:hypothetical protein [Rhizobiaceae bacterium]
MTYATLTTADFLRALEDDGAAIGFALDCLQPYEVREFLYERRTGKDLTPWIEGWRTDHTAAA